MFDHLTYCDIRDSSDCERKTDGIFDTCQSMMDRNGSSKEINLCVPERLGCDNNLHCNTIGSPHGDAFLRGECVTGLCDYQLFLD